MKTISKPVKWPAALRSASAIPVVGRHIANPPSTSSTERQRRRVSACAPPPCPDAETAQTALQAAESGHLVLSTMHTVDAAETISRMIEFFPEGKQQQIRSILAGVLRGVVSQRLLPRADGKGPGQSDPLALTP